MLLRLFIIELEKLCSSCFLVGKYAKKIGKFRKCRLVCRSRAVRQALEGQSVFFVNNILFFVSLFFQQITDVCK